MAKVKQYKSLKARIRQGMKLLDATQRGWRERIQLRNLDLSQPVLNESTGCGCVLAQVFGGYGQGTNTLGIDQQNEAIACGFERPFSGSYLPSPRSAWQDREGEYKQLTEAWKKALTEGVDAL